MNYGRAEYSVDGSVVFADNKYIYDGIEPAAPAGLIRFSGSGSIEPVFSGNALTAFNVDLICNSDELAEGPIVFVIKFRQVTAKISFYETSLDSVSGTWVNRPQDKTSPAPRAMSP